MSSKSKWTGVRANFQATEQKMMKWLILDGSQMNEYILDFAAAQNNLQAGTVWAFAFSLSYV